MQFSSYVSPMDRDYGKSSQSDNSTMDVGVGVKDIGMSVPLGIAAQNVQGVAAKIKAGAGALEIGFTGAGMGQRGAQTPGMYGEDQRRALRELAMATEVNLTTHAAYGINGLAGADQQGNFSHEYRKMAVDEIKQAIDFAAQAANGGSVVVHTGEFQRPISERSWAKNPDGTYKFKHYGEEEQQAVFRVVDDRTGHVVHQIRKNQEVARAVWNKFDEKANPEAWKEKNGKSYKDENGNTVNPGDYIDYRGNKILNPYDPKSGRVPVYDASTGRFKVEVQSWDHFVEEAEERNKFEAQKLGMSLEEYQKKYPKEYLTPEEAMMRATLETNEGHSRGWALNYAQGFEDHKKALDKLKKAEEFYKKLEATITTDEERMRLMREARDVATQAGAGLIPSEYKMPTEILKEAIEDVSRRMEFEHQGSVSQQQQAEDAARTKEHVMTAEKYALKQSFKSYAEAGMHAWEVTRQKKDLDKPVVLTMENIFPESYGAHPEEMINLIEGSRKEMVNMLKAKGLDEQKAKEAAETHIKSTLDTGHLNMWRKYWQNDPKKSLEENDKAFKEWMLDGVKKLAEKKMVGNVHLVDNFGYNDDHLSPGTGTAPCKEIVEMLRKHGYKDAITIEPGADASTDLGDFWGLMKTWKLFGSPVYGAHAPVHGQVPKGSWSQIQYSYFGQVQPPYFVFGSYAPSQDWSLWSQTPME